MPWVFDPHSGGVKIPPELRKRTEHRIRSHAEKQYAGKYTRLDIRFRGALCYIDAYREPEPPTQQLLKITGETREEFLERLRNTPTHLCRLRYLGGDTWSLAFFTYSNEKYTPCVFHSGQMRGTPEEGFDVGAMYLR